MGGALNVSTEKITYKNGTEQEQDIRDYEGNQIERDVLEAKHSDITLLLALQDYGLGVCPELYHAVRTDGRRALPHHGVVA